MYLITAIRFYVKISLQLNGLLFMLVKARGRNSKKFNKERILVVSGESSADSHKDLKDSLFDKHITRGLLKVAGKHQQGGASETHCWVQEIFDVRGWKPSHIEFRTKGCLLDS